MADVRLTATNPEDSSVVPVACNEKGELKLEEPQVVEGPPGEQGPPGPPGQNGDPFSGNFAGDVSFDGDVTIGDSDSDAVLRIGRIDNTNRPSIHITRSPSVQTATDVAISANACIGGEESINFLTNNDSAGFRWFSGGDDITTGIGSRALLARLKTDGSFSFAGGKAGITKDGNLWVTTTSQPNDRYMLDRVSNGLGSWVQYEPARYEKDLIRPMPEESSQDEPETPQ